MAPVAVLVGAPGAGKSTVGRKVARALGVPFTDTDALVEERAGMTIADLFVAEGEPAFRAREEQAVAEALEGDGVVALGGGAVLSERTRALLAGHRVVWLEVGLADAAARVGLNTARPLLLGNVRQTMGRLLEERSPLYAEVAVLRVPTGGRTAAAVAAEVIEALGEPPGALPREAS